MMSNMNFLTYPRSRFRFTECDLRLLRTLQSFLRSGDSSSDSARAADLAFAELLENVWVDPSLQGWSAEAFNASDETEPVKIGDLILPEMGEDRPWDGAADKEERVLFLGLYYGSPRQIILFPNAIELVACSKRFHERYPLPLQRRIDLLTKVVLIHESVHWFTLDPEKHKTRWNLQGEHPVQFTELVETLAELISWLAFSSHAKHEPKVARELLLVQYLSNDPACGYEYQLYWCWLVFSGLAEEREQLQGTEIVDLLSPRFAGRIDAMRTWAVSDQVTHDGDESHLINRIAKVGIKHLADLPAWISEMVGPEPEARSSFERLWKEFLPRVVGLQGMLGDDPDFYDATEI